MSTRKTYRLGTTAIAAVLALSSTQLAAQEAPSIAPPVVDAPTDPAISPAPSVPATAVDPLAPVAEPEIGTTTETPAPVAKATDSAPAAKPAAKRSAPKSPSSTQRPAQKTSATAMPAPTAPAEASTQPLAAEPPTDTTTIAEAAPAKQPKLDEAVPLAGGAGAVILALAGAGMAVRRRKRRDEEEEAGQTWHEEPVMAAEPELGPELSWNPPVVQPKPAAIAPATDLSEDFDTSGFGRHVQAAYGGPTPENPSLSLRKRLKIAGELDRRERIAGITPKPVEANKPDTMSLAEKPAFSFGGTATQAKRHEFAL